MTTLYLDMDGVVADFDSAAAEFLGLDHVRDYVSAHYKITPEEWTQLKTNPRFYRTLPKMKSADSLVDLARRCRDRLGWDLKFLTAVPKNHDMPWAYSDKVLWAQEHYPDIPVMFGPLSVDKQRHCSLGDLLIDDRVDNCERWRAAGGRAFRVEGNDIGASISWLGEILSHYEVSADLARRVSVDLY